VKAIEALFTVPQVAAAPIHLDWVCRTIMAISWSVWRTCVDAGICAHLSKDGQVFSLPSANLVEQRICQNWWLFLVFHNLILQDRLCILIYESKIVLISIAMEKGYIELGIYSIVSKGWRILGSYRWPRSVTATTIVSSCMVPATQSCNSMWNGCWCTIGSCVLPVCRQQFKSLEWHALRPFNTVSSPREKHPKGDRVISYFWSNFGTHYWCCFEAEIRVSNPTVILLPVSSLRKTGTTLT